MRVENWNPKANDAEIYAAAMRRLVAAANIIRDSARAILASKIKENWREHGPNKRHYNKKQKAWINYHGGSGPQYESRYHGEMIDTIRTVTRKGEYNVWIMAGSTRVWWAAQLEYGNGGWRGGAKPFLRPAMWGAESKIKTVLEGGAIGEFEV